MSEKKTRVRQVFGRQKLQVGEKTFVFSMNKSGVSVCATGRGQVELSKSFQELFCFITGQPEPEYKCELIFENVEQVDAAIDAEKQKVKIHQAIIEAGHQTITEITSKIKALGEKRSELQTGQLL